MREILEMDALRHPLPHCLKLLLASLPHLFTLRCIHSFDPNSESSANWPVIAHSNFPPSILFHFDLAQSTVQNAIAPSWRTALFGRIIVVATRVVLVRWCEAN